jgi:hypothetical protein
VTFLVSAVDDKGVLITNVNIQVSGPASGNGVGAGGQLTFKDFPEGAYNVKAQAKGFKDAQMSIEVKPNMAAVTITLAKKAAKESGEGKVDFAVLVVDKHGTPVANANIQLSGPASGGGTAPAGQLNFNGSPEGTYEIKVSAKDYITESMPLTVSADMGGEIGGVTGVTILLEKKKAAPAAKPQAAAVPSAAGDLFAGTWQGQARVIRDDNNSANIGKTNPAKFRIVASGDNCTVYMNDSSEGFQMARQGNTLVYQGQPQPFILNTLMGVALKLTVTSQDVMTGEQKLTLYAKDKTGTVTSALNLKRTVR